MTKPERCCFCKTKWPDDGEVRPGDRGEHFGAEGDYDPNRQRITESIRKDRGLCVHCGREPGKDYTK